MQQGNNHYSDENNAAHCLPRLVPVQDVFVQHSAVVPRPVDDAEDDIDEAVDDRVDDVQKAIRDGGDGVF